MKKLLIIVVAVLLVGGILLALFMPAKPKARPADLVFISSDTLHGFDPQRSSWMVDFRILGAMFETLVRVDPATNQIVPGAAELPEISDDRKTYVFRIRPEAKWSNGDPVRAQDYIYGWRRALLPDISADYVSLMWYIKGAKPWWEKRNQRLLDYARNEAGQSPEAARQLYQQDLASFDENVSLEALDDRTLKVELINPIPYFLHLVAFPTFSPVHEPSISRFLTGPDPRTGRIDFNRDWMAPGNVITNGPYVLAERNKEQDLLLKANEHYWNLAGMQNRSIYMKILKDPAAARIYYEDGQADWWPSVPTIQKVGFDLVEAAKQGTRKDVSYYTAAGTYFYIFNCQEKLPDGRDNPFRSREVRQAFGMAIDRGPLVSNVVRAGQQLARTFVPPVFDGYEPPVEAGPTLNVERAKKLLADAGYPGGQGLEGLNILVNDLQGHKVVAQYVISEWKKNLGVDVGLEVMPSTPFGEARKNQQFSVARGNWFGDYPDPTTFLTMYLSEGNNNDAKWKNDEFDALLDKAQGIADPAERMRVLQQAEQLLLEEAPITPLFYYVWVELYDPQRVSGIGQDPLIRKRLELIKVEHAK